MTRALRRCSCVGPLRLRDAARSLRVHYGHIICPAIPSIDEFREIQRDLLFVSSPEVMAAFKEVFTTSHEKLLARGMTVQQSRDRRSDVARTLYNAMRSDLFPGQKPLPSELIGFLEPKVPGAA